MLLLCVVSSDPTEQLAAVAVQWLAASRSSTPPTVVAMANANGLAQISIVDICRLGGQLFRLLIFPSTSFNFQFSSMARGVGGLPNRGRLKWLQFTRARLAQDSHRTGRPVIKNFWYYLCKKKTNNETKSKPKNKNENESIKFALPWKHANKFGSTQSVGRQRLKFECNVSIRSSRYKCICICICCSKSHGCRASALSHLPWLPMAIGNFCKIRCWLLRNEKVLIWSLFLLLIWGGVFLLEEALGEGLPKSIAKAGWNCISRIFFSFHI